MGPDSMVDKQVRSESKLGKVKWVRSTGGCEDDGDKEEEAEAK